MRNQKHDAVFCERLQIDERLLFRVLIERGERIVQNEDRLIVAQRAGKRKALCLTAGKVRAAAANERIFAVDHFRDLLLHARSV